MLHYRQRHEIRPLVHHDIEKPHFDLTKYDPDGAKQTNIYNYIFFYVFYFISFTTNYCVNSLLVLHNLTTVQMLPLFHAVLVIACVDAIHAL